MTITKLAQRTCALAFAALTMGLLLGTGATSAATVLFEDGGTKATGINDLNIGGTVYDVDFDSRAFAFDVYGTFPGTFFFNNATDALAAVNAMNAALNASPATSVGEAGEVVEAPAFNIGYGSEGGTGDINFVLTARGVCGDQCVEWTSGGTNQLLYEGDQRTWATFTVVGGGGGVDLTGTVQDQGGTPLCSLTLASGQFVFTCDPNGPYSLLDLPTESDGTVKRQVYVDGFFPNVETLSGSADETVVMTRATNCPDYNSFPEPGVFPGSAGNRLDVSGTVLLQNTQTPVCAMVLGNGQFGFTCDGTGTYSANIPLDNNGQYKLQVYADGFAPMVQRFDEFSPNVEVRMARAVECQ